MIEPTETGHRIRLYTFKGSARGGLLGGLSIFAMGAILIMSVVLSGEVTVAALLASAVVCTMGLGTAGFTAMTLPVWELDRRRQMDEIANLAVSLAEKSDRPRQDSQLSPTEVKDSTEVGQIDLHSDADMEEPTPARSRSRER